MTGLPPPAKVAGAHTSIYEDYYKLMDPRNEGKIPAAEAAKFLKKSKLSDAVLGEIWDLADPISRGYLDKSGIFVALKLCALVQQGHSLNVSNIYLDVAPPIMEGATSSCWAVSASDRKKYEQLFLNLEPINGYIPGNKVKGVLMDSKLPLETLGKIWDLADIDNDGRLNLHEFTVAMHLVYKALEKNTIPTVLPSELADIGKSSGNNNALNLYSISSANFGSTESTRALIPGEWVVSREDQLAADQLFAQADKDMDGFVSGSEIKDTFIQSGLTQPDLAVIWNLCDMFNTGKLNKEQFALSRWLIKQRLNGAELPTKLTNEMIPPSLRKKNCENIENNNVCTYTNPELNMINSEISEIMKEKHIIEQDIAQKEADIQIRTSTIKSLQNELESLSETLRQLNCQKGEAQKGLNELKAKVEKLRQQASDQETTIRTEEEEIHARRQEIKALKIAESNLQSQKSECKSELNHFLKQLQTKQLKISQIKANMTQLEEQQHQIVEATALFDAALTAGNPSLVSESTLSFKPNLDKRIISGRNININISEPTVNDQKKSSFIKNYLKDKKSSRLSKNEQFAKQNRDPLKAAFPDPTENMKDPFGDDPFTLHTPLPLDSSPGPALPPKQSKLPPPRPAPRRPAQPPVTKPRSSISKPPIVSRSSNVKPIVSRSSNVKPIVFRSSDTNPVVTPPPNINPFAGKSKFIRDGKGALDFADFANFDSTTRSITDDFITRCKLEENINYSNSSVVNSVTDFDEDPFANYRYEDLSMISDPFADGTDDFKKVKSKSKHDK